MRVAPPMLLCMQLQRIGAGASGGTTVRDPALLMEVMELR